MACEAKIHLVYSNNGYSYSHPLSVGENIIGSHLLGFQSKNDTDIPQYGLKITVFVHQNGNKEADEEFDIEIEAMNTHFNTRNLTFGKLKNDRSVKPIRPGRVYIVECGDEFGYADTQISIKFYSSHNENLIEQNKDIQAVENIVIGENLDILNAATFIVPKPILESNKNQIEPNLNEEGKKFNSFKIAARWVPNLSI